MDSQPFDQSRDPLLAFASEVSVTPTADREPAFLRIPTPYDGHLSIMSIAAEQAPSETVRARRMTTVAVIIGVLAGFAGGYAFADRIIAPAATPAHRATAPMPPPAPTPAPGPAPVAAAASLSESPSPRTEASTESPREPGMVKAAQSTNPNVAPVPSAPSTTKRASIPSSTTRPSPTTRPRSTVAPITDHGGAIEIMSRPRDALVFLDGIAVGRAPMSIPDIAEGMHEVRVELEGFSPWVGSVRVKGGSRARVGASLER